MGSICVDKTAWDEPKLISCYGSVERKKILDGKYCKQAASGTNVHLRSYRVFRMVNQNFSSNLVLVFSWR